NGHNGECTNWLHNLNDPLWSMSRSVMRGKDPDRKGYRPGATPGLSERSRAYVPETRICPSTAPVARDGGAIVNRDGRRHHYRAQGASIAPLPRRVGAIARRTR